MGNEHTSRIVQAPGIETNEGELARPPIVRYNIGDEDIELSSENDRDVFTEAPRSATYRFLPPKQAEVFLAPAECYSSITVVCNSSSSIVVIECILYCTK